MRKGPLYQKKTGRHLPDDAPSCAERVGFEPTEPREGLNTLAGCRFRPLSHLSVSFFPVLFLIYPETDNKDTGFITGIQSRIGIIT